MAVPAVGLMVLAGLILSIVQLETPAALLTTDYGRIFLAKMAAVLCLLALAALNRQRLTPMLASRMRDRAICCAPSWARSVSPS